MKKFLLGLLLVCGLSWATVESVTYISDLNTSYPAAGDAKSEGDDHIRNLKTALRNTFPNISGAVTPTHTELNYVDGVTSAIQTQLDAKAATGAVGSSGLTMSTSRLLGRTTASSGAVEQITVGAGLSLSGGALTAISSADLLSTVTAASSSTVDLETTFDGTYDAYMIVVSGATFSGSANLTMRMKVGGAYASANYAYHVAAPVGGNASYTNATSSSASSIVISPIGATAGDHANLVIYVFNPASTSLSKSMSVTGIVVNGGSTYSVMGGGANTSTSALTGVRFLLSSGTIETGKFRLYGIRNS